MVLETRRLILRDWEERDIEDLMEGLGSLEVSRWLAYVPHPYTREDAQRWVRYCAGLAARGEPRAAHEFAIELKPEGKVIGGVSLDRVNRVQGTAGGGIWMNPAYHGHGYGAEAFGRRIAFAFVDLGLRRLENGYFAGNPTSFAMQSKFGYQVEGIRRQAYRCLADGELKDEYITALLVEDWIRGTTE